MSGSDHRQRPITLRAIVRSDLTTMKLTTIGSVSAGVFEPDQPRHKNENGSALSLSRPFPSGACVYDRLHGYIARLRIYGLETPELITDPNGQRLAGQGRQCIAPGRLTARSRGRPSNSCDLPRLIPASARPAMASH